jgi:hypothetical protein
MTMPVGLLVQAVVLSVSAALIAGYFPARWAARHQVVEGLREDSSVADQFGRTHFWHWVWFHGETEEIPLDLRRFILPQMGSPSFLRFSDFNACPYSSSM